MTLKIYIIGGFVSRERSVVDLTADPGDRGTTWLSDTHSQWAENHAFDNQERLSNKTWHAWQRNQFSRSATCHWIADLFFLLNKLLLFELILDSRSKYLSSHSRNTVKLRDHHRLGFNLSRCWYLLVHRWARRRMFSEGNSAARTMHTSVLPLGFSPKKSQFRDGPQFQGHDWKVLSHDLALRLLVLNQHS